MSSRVALSFVIGSSLLAVQVQQAVAQILPALPPQPASGVQQAGGDVATGPAAGEVQQTGWPKITMPKVTMPKVTMPKIAMPDMSKMMSPVSSGYKKVTAGSRKAWEGTKEMFSFGKPKHASPMAAQPKQSFWQKLIGRSPQPAAPQTVGEWMSQPRLEP